MEASSEVNPYANVHNSFLQNSQNLKNPKYLNGTKNKQMVVNSHNRICSRNKKQWIFVTHNNMDMKTCLVNKTRSKSKHTMWFYLHEILEQVQLTYSDSSMAA